MAVVSDVSRVEALERTRGSSLPEALSDKQVHTDWPACADKGYTFWVDGFVWEGDDDGLFIIDGDGMFSDGKVSGAESSSGMS